MTSIGSPAPEEPFAVPEGFNDWDSFLVESSDSEHDSDAEFSDISENDSDDKVRSILRSAGEGPETPVPDDDQQKVFPVSYVLYG